MFSPFETPLSPVLNRMMAESVVFEQQGGQQQGQGSGGGNPSTANSCYNNSYSTYFQKVYDDSANNYRIYRIQKYGSNGGYQFFSWNSASTPTSSQITNMKRNLNGLVPNGDSRCSLPSNPGFTLLNNTPSQDSNGWKTYKDIHESANAGCTDSRNPNYNSSALTMDNSCSWTESSGVKYTKKSSLAADKIRFEGTIKEEYRPIPAGSEYRLTAIIKRVCTSFCCGSSEGVKETVIVNSFDSPVITLTSNSGNSAYNTALNNMKSQVDNAVQSSFDSWNPIISTTSNTNTYKTSTSCDGTKFTIERIVKTTNCGGNTVEVIYNFTKNGSIVKTETWNEATGLTNSKFISTIPKDPEGRTGYDGLSSHLQYLVKQHEASLPSQSSGFDIVKLSAQNQGVIQGNNQQMYLVTYLKTPFIIDGCGVKMQSGDKQYFSNSYVYDFGPENQERPSFKGVTPTGIKVQYAGSSIEPTNVYGPFDEKPDSESLGLKVIRGCMDESAENYNPDANTEGNYSCKYPSKESGNNIDIATDSDTNYTPYLIGGLALTALYVIL
tara:strand:- start:15464 stop:17119 length:1656 start_codon:yes stop_codon:yes gene_type:complete